MFVYLSVCRISCTSVAQGNGQVEVEVISEKFNRLTLERDKYRAIIS